MKLISLGYKSDLILNVSEFLENGFELEAKSVLSAQSVHKPPKFNEELLVRPIEKNQDWAEMIELQTNCAHENLPRHEWEKFYKSQSNRYQAMVRSGRGNWYGGYLGNRLVAGLGIFHSNGVGSRQQTEYGVYWWDRSHSDHENLK